MKVERFHNTLCITRHSKRSTGAKDPLRDGGLFRRVCLNKKGAGRIAIRPAWTPISLWSPTTAAHLRRQNLAALGTAAGKNLAAVGSSHSLTETVHLGSVATAGLIGTLHILYTSCQITICSTVRRPQQNIVTDHNMVMLAHYNP